MHKYLLPLIVSSVILLTSPLLAEDKSEGQERRGSQAGWSTFSRGGGAVYQFDTDLAKGGSYNSSRFNIQAGRIYSWDRRTSVSLALNYSYDSYSFSNGIENGISAFNPWENINSFSISSPMRLGINERWPAFLIPSLRSSGESGASFDETLTGEAFAGFSYKVGDWLTIGPGIGVISQLEESATVLPTTHFLFHDCQTPAKEHIYLRTNLRLVFRPFRAGWAPGSKSEFMPCFEGCLSPT